MTSDDTNDASPDTLRVEHTLEYEKLIEENEWPSPHDKLERHKEIERHTSMLTNSSGPFVFGLDSDWGGGKTFTVQLWRLYLKKELGISSIYLNAWEGDYSLDPLVSLLAQIDTWLSQQKGKKGSWEKAKQLAPALIKGVAGSIYKNASVAGLKASNIADPIIESIDKANNQDFIVAYQETQQSMREFRNCLNDALTCLPEHQKNLIIFVDELDRCNPTYAIMMLERIKHLFNIEKIVFVLSINSEQLIEAFKGVYGIRFNGKNYLKRFLDSTRHLKEPDIDHYLSYIFEESKYSRDFQRWKANEEEPFYSLRKTSSLIFSKLGYTLRDIDQIATEFRIMSRSFPSKSEKGIILPMFIICMIVLYKEDFDLYSKYKSYAPHAIRDKVIKCLTGVVFGAKDDLPENFGYVAGTIISFAFRGSEQDKRNKEVSRWSRTPQDDVNPDRQPHEEMIWMKNVASLPPSQFAREGMRAEVLDIVEMFYEMGNSDQPH